MLIRDGNALNECSSLQIFAKAKKKNVWHISCVFYDMSGAEWGKGATFQLLPGHTSDLIVERLMCRVAFCACNGYVDVGYQLSLENIRAVVDGQATTLPRQTASPSSPGTAPATSSRQRTKSSRQRTNEEIMGDMNATLRQIPYGGAHSSDERNVLDTKLSALKEMKISGSEKARIARELEEDYARMGFT